MRITQNSTVSIYAQNLMEARDRFTQNQLQMTTQKRINSLTDQRFDLSEARRLTNTLGRRQTYQGNIDASLTQSRIYQSTLDSTQTHLNEMRDIALIAVQPINNEKLAVLSSKLRGLIDDMGKLANTEFDGKLIFSGTKTTRNSITPTSPATTNLPFELVRDPALVSTTNPEGLRMVFQGNNNARIVQTSETTSEVINTSAQSVFGGNGTQTFEDAIRLYNIMRYKPDGTQRTTEPLTPAENGQIANILQGFSQAQDRFVTETARMGGVENRMEILTDQANNEITRIKELRSLKEDIDIGQVALDLKKNETVLDATLQVGRDIIQRSLLDFLR